MRLLAGVIASTSLLVGSIQADELVLKDGKKVEWVALRDLGDSVEIETKQGTKATLKKSDIERVVLASGDAPPPLTGATFNFDKKRKLEVIDAFAKVDPKKGVGGDWKLAGGVLTGTAPTAMINSRLSLGVKPPGEEYDINFSLERTQGKDGFWVGFIAGGRQVAFFIDEANSNWSGPHVVDGNGDPVTNGLGKTGAVLKNGTPRLITIMVRSEALIVQVDKKDYFAWKADWKRLSIQGHTGVPEQDVLFVGMRAGSTYQIRGMTLMAPKS